METIILRLEGMEKVHRKYAKQNNATVKTLDTKVE